MCERINSFQYSIIYYNFTSDWNCPLNVIALDFRGDIFIPHCFVVGVQSIWCTL